MSDMMNRKKEYTLLLEQWDMMFDAEYDTLAMLCNTTALLQEFYGEVVNWVGFYRLKEDTLVLGPFQGKVACAYLYKDKGVCQKAVSTKGTVIVSNVHVIQDHIACDSASNSEIVVPIIKNNQVIGVLDIDSPLFDSFDHIDAEYLYQLTDRIAQRL